AYGRSSPGESEYRRRVVPTRPLPHGRGSDRTVRGSGSEAWQGMTRRSLVIGFAALGRGIPAGKGVQSNLLRGIGLAVGDDPEGGERAFRERLRELGHVEGQNLSIEKRRVRGTIAELMRMDLDLVVVNALGMALAARETNPAMPLVIVTTPGFIS